MIEIGRQTDRIVRRLKRRARLAHVRFVREYAAERAEMPLSGMLAVVGITQTVREKGCIGGYLSSSERGERYSVKAEIRVYAPPGENGTGLSELLGCLREDLETADEEQVITGAAAGSIEFDPDWNAVFRRVQFDMAFCLREED